MSFLINPFQFVAGGGGFAPSDLANLQYWFDASDAATITEAAGKVSQWDDKSGNNRDVAQGTGALQPTITTDGGFDAIDFTSDLNVRLQVKGLASIDKSNGTLFVAFRYNALVGSDRYLLDSEASVALYLRAKTGAGNMLNHSNVSAGSAYQVGITADTSRTAFVSRYNGTSGDIEDDDGNTASDGSIGTINSNYTGICIGSVLDGGLGFDGFVHEIGFYNDKLSDTDRDDLLAYLVSKWGI